MVVPIRPILGDMKSDAIIKLYRNFILGSSGRHQSYLWLYKYSSHPSPPLIAAKGGFEGTKTPPPPKPFNKSKMN